MPYTAKVVAKQAKLPYSKSRLTDLILNIILILEYDLIILQDSKKSN